MSGATTPTDNLEQVDSKMLMNLSLLRLCSDRKLLIFQLEITTLELSLKRDKSTPGASAMRGNLAMEINLINSCQEESLP